MTCYLDGLEDDQCVFDFNGCNPGNGDCTYADKYRIENRSECPLWCEFSIIDNRDDTLKESVCLNLNGIRLQLKEFQAKELLKVLEAYFGDKK